MPLRAPSATRAVRGATLESVSSYVAGLGREAKATRACSALKSWYTWLTERNVIRKNPTARLKFKEAWALRDLQPALSSLLLDEGLTAPQIAALRWSDVVRPLADGPRKARVRVGKRTRSISTDTHRAAAGRVRAKEFAGKASLHSSRARCRRMSGTRPLPDRASIAARKTRRA